jgi:hypothetical protein
MSVLVPAAPSTASKHEMEFERHYRKRFVRRQRQLLAAAERHEKEKELCKRIYAKYSPYSEPTQAAKFVNETNFSYTGMMGKETKKSYGKFNERHPEVTLSTV